MSNYPNALDSDLEIPRISDNVSEISGDVINSIRDAIFAIQRVIGLNAQGNKASLVDRINVSIDANGNIKKASLERVGMVTLPVADRHVASNAAIKESKLDLDVPTRTLSLNVASLATTIQGIQSAINALNAAFSEHTLGLGYEHDGYQITINSAAGTQYGIAGLEATTISDAISEIGTILLSGNNSITPHINLNLPSSVKHQSAEISVNTTNFTVVDRAATNVQLALDSIDAGQGALGATHLDRYHTNGILKNADSSSLYNENNIVIGPIANIEYSSGSTVIEIPGVTEEDGTVSFASLGVQVGDIVQIASNLDLEDVGTYQIRAIGPLESSVVLGSLPDLSYNQISVFHIFSESIPPSVDTSVTIYKPAIVSSESAPLACAVRNNETLVDSISILNPGAARVVSLGFNSLILNSDGYQIAIRAGVGVGQKREVTIPDLNKDRLGTGQASPVDAQSVAERINAYVSDPDIGLHFPISAYRIGNELAIAHNLVGSEYTIEVLDGYTGNFALGLDAYGANIAGQIISGNENNCYVVNGVQVNQLHTVFQGYAEISAETDNFGLWTTGGDAVNPLALGIGPGSVMHITDHPTISANGSYTIFTANTTSVSTFAAEKIPCPYNPTRFNVTFTDSNISLSSLDNAQTDLGVVQLFVDEFGNVMTHQRIKYGTNLGSAVEVVDVSDGFPVGDFVLNIGLSANMLLFNIIDGSLPGATVSVHEYFKGSFKLYHPNNIDFFNIKIGPGIVIGGLEIVSVQPRLIDDNAMELCTAHFNGNMSITNIIDGRLFGNISANEIRDDFIEIYSQRPVAELRSNGVVRGFDLLDILYLDSITSMQALPVQGGVAYVSGVRIEVESQKVTIPSYDEGGATISGNRIVGINEFGSLQIFTDSLGEILCDGYNSSASFGKILPLYNVRIVNGGIETVTDIRSFINSIDAKLDIVVDGSETNIVGNFKTLDGAIVYASSYPNKEKLTIRIINSVVVSEAIAVPNGISICGHVPYGGNSNSQIINTRELDSALVTLYGNNKLENVEITSETAAMKGALVYVAGSNTIVKNCNINFGQGITTYFQDVAIEVGVDATSDVEIYDNKINTAYSGIVSEYGCDNLKIYNNRIEGISGTGGVASAIKIGSSARQSSGIYVYNNTIDVPSVVQNADIRGISVDVGQTINIFRIYDNSIVHSAENTMTNGIRVENEDATGNLINELYITGNTIKGIKLDDNYVYGIYVDSAAWVKIHNNKLDSIGVFGNTDVSGIKIAAGVTFAEIDSNYLSNMYTSKGIDIINAKRAVVTNNTLFGLGTSSQYISGNATHAMVTNNSLVGPGLRGISWSGTNSKISDNSMSKPNDGSGTDYAFEEWAFYIQTSDVEISNNMVTGMVYDQESSGLTNISSGRDRLKIIGNTISGSKMSRFIQLYGDGHIVSNNKLHNEEHAVAAADLYVELNAVTNAIVMGNMMSGEGSTAISSSGTAIDNVTIANNIVTASLTTAPLVLSNDSVANCLIIGNKFPDSNNNIIGVTPNLGTYNNNVIGINVGLTDTMGVPASAATTSHDSDYTPHWSIKIASDHGYWQVSETTVSYNNRRLYFPIMGIPNGSRLTSVQIQGRHDNSATLTAILAKRSVKSVVPPAFVVSYMSSLTTISASGYFGAPGSGVGLVTCTSTGGEIINYAESNYYLIITAVGAPATPSNIQIHGITLNIRY